MVLLPQRVHATGEAALGISDHLGEAVGVFVEPGDRDTKGFYVFALCLCTCFGRIFFFTSMTAPIYPYSFILKHDKRISVSLTFLELLSMSGIDFDN